MHEHLRLGHAYRGSWGSDRVVLGVILDSDGGTVRYVPRNDDGGFTMGVHREVSVEVFNAWASEDLGAVKCTGPCAEPSWWTLALRFLR